MSSFSLQCTVFVYVLHYLLFLVFSLFPLPPLPLLFWFQSVMIRFLEVVVVFFLYFIIITYLLDFKDFGVAIWMMVLVPWDDIVACIAS